MLLIKRFVLKEHLCKLPSNTAHDLPVGWAEVGTKNEATLKKQEVSKDVGEGSHDVKVVLQLPKATLSVIGVHHNAVVVVRDAQIPNADQQLQFGPAELAFELSL